jgi:hypothetical protein
MLYIGSKNESRMCFIRGPAWVFELQLNSTVAVACNLAVGKSPLDWWSLWEDWEISSLKYLSEQK